MRLLLAEDNARDRMLFRMALGNDADVTEVLNGAEAIERFLLDNFDILVFDDAMPKKTGFEAAVAIRDIDPDIPIVIWSGCPGDVAEMMAQDVHAVFISKHRPIEELVAAIKTAWM